MNRRSFLKLIGTATVAGVLGYDKHKKAIAKIIEDITPEVPVAEAPALTPRVKASEAETANLPEATPEVTPTKAQEFGSEPESMTQLDTDPTTLELELFPTYEKPFRYREINEVMRELNLNLGDLFEPNQEKVKNFTSIFTSSEVLPIFTPEVMKWSELVQRKCFEYNLENPNNKINPNFILSIISLESQGIAEAKSPAGALGLMQLTSIVYGEGFFGNYNSRSILDPENNIEVGIAYFGDIIKKAKKIGLEGFEVYQYASMEYNGGPKNASRFFKTKQALDVNGADSELFSIDSDDKIKSFLKGFYGNSREYYTYGTNLVKKETLFYKENLTRFGVIAEISKKLLDKGHTEEQVRMMLSESTLFKSLISHMYIARRGIREQKGFVSYFDFKNLLGLVASENFDDSQISVVDKATSKNPANLMLDLIYS